MQKIGDSTNTANAAGEYTQGQPGSGVVATLITAQWLNTIQRELVNLVLGAGLALDTADNSQVFKAIQAIQTAANTWAKLNGKPTTVSGFGITDAFTKTETTAAVQQAVAALVASSPAALDTLKELADALGNDPNFASTVTTALANKASKATTLAGYGISDTYTKAVLDALMADQWAFLPIGVPIPSFANIPGVLNPPTDKGYRYILLTASSAYNSGVLTGEVVTGSAPLITATAVVNLAGSPMNGSTVPLINTERRFLRAEAGYTKQDDALQNITGAFGGAENSASTIGAFANGAAFGTVGPGGSARNVISFDASRVARTDVETRPRNVGVHYFMRIK